MVDLGKMEVIGHHGFKLIFLLLAKGLRINIKNSYMT
jgi:hypothetical protein